MNLIEAIEKKALLLDCTAADKAELLEVMIKKLCKSSRVKGCDAVHEAIIEREELSSTGMGRGVAMPHARLSGVSFPTLGFARLPDGVDFDSVDGQPVKLVFMLLTPSSNPELNVQLLGKLSRICMKEENREKLLAVEKTTDLLTLVREWDAENGFGA